MSNLTYKISEDENTVVTFYNVYQFTESRKGCYRCELLSLCIHESSDDSAKDFPFPCMSDNRQDKRSGIFLKHETIANRRFSISAIVAILFFMLSILVYFKIIPNIIESWLNH